jgi:OOP family OmpA-OmpF porin
MRNHSGLSRVAYAALALTTLIAVPALAERPMSLDIGLFGGYDMKASNHQLGDPKPNEDPAEVAESGAGFGLRLGFNVLTWLGIEGEAKYVMSSLPVSGDAAAIPGLRAHAMINFMHDQAIRPFVRIGAGSEMLSTSSDSKSLTNSGDSDSVFIAGAGSRFELTEDLGLRLDLLGLVVPAMENAKAMEFEGWLGVYYLIGGTPRDTDGDGIFDRDDKCKTEVEDKDGFQDTDGCPDTDNDNDGILDAADKCPDDAEIKNGMKDDDGCPDGDIDGDKIEDSDDKCPKVAENSNGFEDTDGCPDDPDTDGDGIRDSKDKCVKEKETINGYLDDDGCPDVEPDTDADGIVDSKDKCPNEPETVNSYQDDDGCPDKVPDRLKKFSGAIAGIVFETGSAKILPASFKILDGAVAVLIEFKDTKIEVEGHTDNVGNAEANKKLSFDRAESVKTYFVSKGIATERITTMGFGAEKPVADNAKKAGQAKNRRIEFKLL